MTTDLKDTLGIIVPLQGMYSYSEILQGAQSIAIPLGYRIRAFYGSGHGLHQYYDKSRIAAWAIINSVEGNSWLEELDDTTPQLIISPAGEDYKRSIVIPDNVGGSRLVVDHLISHGHERIVFVGALKHADIAGRYRGYQQALQQAGLPYDPALTVNITSADFWSRRAADEGLSVLINNAIPFSAVFAASDELAFGVITALQKAGLSIPQQVAVVGFDDSPPASISRPPLTTVRQSFIDIGSTAARVLIDLVQGSLTGQHVYEVMSHVIVRTSCGCMPQYMHEDLLTSVSDQVDKKERAIINIAEVLVTGADVPTSYIYPIVRLLYSGFYEVFVSKDLATWSQVLEQTLPPLLARPELVNNLPVAIQLLHQYVPTSDEVGIEKSILEEHAKRLITIAERAAVFLGVLGNHIQNSRWFDLSNTIHRITRTMAQLDYEQLISLQWLQNSDIHYAALFLVSSEHSSPQLMGVFSETETSGIAPLQQTVEHIPPTELLVDTNVPLAIINVLEFKQQIQGILYVIPQEGSSATSQTYYGIWVEQLAALLSRFKLEDSLRQNNESLRVLHEQERSLSNMIRDLSAPVVPVTDGIVVLPLIGIIDDIRAEQIMTNLLESVNIYDAEVIVLDITGVPLVDTQTASHLLRAAQAVRLLGARVIITGIRPEIAQTVVQLGIDTTQITTAANMEAGLRYALRLRGLQISALPRTPGR